MSMQINYYILYEIKKLFVNHIWKLFTYCFSGGPYSAFGGRDASRGLAKFTVDITDNDYDDLSDLNAMEMESVREWEMQFKGWFFYNNH